MKSPSIDTFVACAVYGRWWAYGAVFLLCVYSHFHWVWVLLYVGITGVEVVVTLNSAFTKAPKWNLLGESDVALVTGGLSGLGLEIVKKLAIDYRVGKVIVYDIQKPRVELSSNVEFCLCDIDSHASLTARIDDTIRDLNQQNRHISVLVNNAGVRYSGPLLNMDNDEIRRLFGVNVFASITLLRAVVRNHLEYFSTRQLSIVTVSSVLGSFGPKNLLVYSASKAATTQIHECLAEELRPHNNISMLLVMPGQLTTDMFKDVSPSRTFFAPVVNHAGLALSIVAKVSRGESGVLCEPFYANFLPAVKVLPAIIQHWCRRFSRMDEKIPDI